MACFSKGYEKKLTRLCITKRCSAHSKKDAKTVAIAKPAAQKKKNDVTVSRV